MLDKIEIKKLLYNKEYDEIINIFRNEFTDMIFEFAKKNNLEINNDTEVEELIVLINLKFPKLEGCMDIISNLLTSPDMTIGEHLNNMIDNYDIIKKLLT